MKALEWAQVGFSVWAKNQISLCSARGAVNAPQWRSSEHTAPAAPAHCSPLLSSQRTAAAAKPQQTFRCLVGLVSFVDSIRGLGPYSGSKWIICFLSTCVFALSSTVLHFHLPNVIGVHCLQQTVFASHNIKT